MCCTVSGISSFTLWWWQNSQWVTYPNLFLFSLVSPTHIESSFQVILHLCLIDVLEQTSNSYIGRSFISCLFLTFCYFEQFLRFGPHDCAYFLLNFFGLKREEALPRMKSNAMTQLFCLPTKESYFLCEISTALVTHFLVIQLTHTELMIFLLFIWF